MKNVEDYDVLATQHISQRTNGGKMQIKISVGWLKMENIFEVVQTNNE